MKNGIMILLICRPFLWWFFCYPGHTGEEIQTKSAIVVLIDWKQSLFPQRDGHNV